jgi:hypothetical protein
MFKNRFHDISSAEYGSKLYRSIPIAGDTLKTIIALKQHLNYVNLILVNGKVKNIYFLFVGDEQVASFLGEFFHDGSMVEETS